MGLDFRIEQNTPKVSLRLSDRKQILAQRDIDANEAMSIAERMAYLDSEDEIWGEGSVLTVSFEKPEPTPSEVISASGFPISAHWAYSGFQRFRTRLAAVYGLNWEQMLPSDPGNKLYGQADTDHPDWDKASKLDIYPLLNHSDCDGDMSPEDCGQVAPALRKAVESWPEDDTDREQALRLANMMDVCAKYQRRLIFC